MAHGRTRSGYGRLSRSEGVKALAALLKSVWPIKNGPKLLEVRLFRHAVNRFLPLGVTHLDRLADPLCTSGYVQAACDLRRKIERQLSFETHRLDSHRLILRHVVEKEAELAPAQPHSA